MSRFKYIVDGNGKRISVILSIKDYAHLLDKIQELEDVKIYDKVKLKNEKGILLEDYIKKRSNKHA